MALVSLQEVSIGFGGPLVLEKVNLAIERGEWVGLLGRNGAGKSTLLKLVAGELLPDEGVVVRQGLARAAYLPQEIPPGMEGALAEIVASGLQESSGFQPAEGLEQSAGQVGSWQGQLQVERVIYRMGLNPLAQFGTLSAGLKRRALLARALVRDPDLLLLDEPTNHLDLPSIRWLEDFLARWGGTLLFVTHDRAFLQRLAGRILELDRGRLFDWNCDYPTFVQRKEAMLEAETEGNVQFDRKLAQEEAWIRRGVEARRTRNEGRVRALQRLREVRRERREQPGKVRMQIQEARHSGRLVIEAEGVSYAYDERVIVRDFSTTLLRGDKVGIIGPNGSGKTTLLHLLMGEMAPQQGRVRLGTNLEIAYFDQLRAGLDEGQSAVENVGQGSDTVTINGRARNVIGYLQDFLFEPARARAPIAILSGGERNRLLLARLFARPANLLVMDEPTNDLDLETLELLENLLLDYAGTLLLVSHDRAFLNNLVTSTLALEGGGRVSETVGGYDDWLRQKEAETARSEPTPGKPAPPERPAAPREGTGAPRKPSYKEQRLLEAQKEELARMPERIDHLEREQAELAAAMADPAFYAQDAPTIARAAERAHELQAELARAFERWEELERILGDST